MAVIITVAFEFDPKLGNPNDLLSNCIARTREANLSLLSEVESSLGPDVTEEKLVCGILSRLTGKQVISFRPVGPDLSTFDSGTAEG